MKRNNYISVSGYGSTGSSAVVNLLEEVSSCYVFQGEFRLIQEPDGLADLYFNLKKFWGWNRSDAYIRRFIHYTNILGRNPHYFQFGENWNKKLNYRFFKIRDEFLNEIVDTKWKGYWFYHDYQERNPFRIFIERLKRYTRRFGVPKEFIRKITKKTDTYFVRHDIDIESAVRKFVDKVFNELTCCSKEEKEYIVLDQLVLPYNTEIFKEMLGDFKQIIVDRDPRDVYLDAMTYNAYPITKDIKTFISFYQSQHTRENITNKDNILQVQFEDLVYNYEEEISKIFNFLSINQKHHTLKGTRFNPILSVKNVRTWEQEKFAHYYEDINEIEKKLSSWCYYRKRHK